MTMIVKVGGKAPAKPAAQETPKPEKKKKDKCESPCSERCPGDPWLYCAVLWCACAMSLVSSGFSLHRQQALTARLALLEEQHRALRAAVLEPQQPPAPVLDPPPGRLRRDAGAPDYWRPRRSIRDYGDCVCPPGK
ncbi:hypothetical protein JYU34_003992 [Plutella xylostella]|uniref:Uncharacterized protein n=1 Tax=Plutella xylostella TaxID=51655 RepID=A0ABQ7QWW5_PLUXY|nr:hypothetical protein JYU34_003992 [Plutella xylostella]